MKYFRFGLWLLICLFTVQANAVPSDDSKLPPELRALFVEAFDEISLKPLLDFPNFDLGPAFWIDDHRVIFTSRSFNGWVARNDERSKILIYNVDAEQTEETPYRGNLRCFGLEGEMRIQDYPLPFHGFIQPGDTEKDAQKFIRGFLGQPQSTFVPEQSSGAFDQFTCQHYKNRNPVLPPNYYFFKLREADGVVEKPDYEAASGIVRLRAPNGRIGWEVNVDRVCNRFPAAIQYLKWARMYYAQASFGNLMCESRETNSWLFSQDSIQIKPLPPLLHEAGKMTRGLRGNGITYWARRGMYFVVQRSFYEALDGLYFEEPETRQLKRIHKQPWRLDTLSPNGCRALIRTKPVTVIELCKGKNLK